MIKLKDLMKVIPPNKLIQITYIRKGRPTIIEIVIAEDVKLRNQYLVEEIVSYQAMLKIKVREKRRVK